jgi:alpha-N-arabinofuranosidase
LQATLKIDLERRLGTIDPNIYGNFIEHLGRCIYTGIYDEGSPLADADGNRKDVLEAARRLHVTQLRWPGGNFGSGYHWQDGIGSRDARPARYDLAWFERESNRFGTDEFISTCRKLGAAPYICVNVGTGNLDEASSWVEYCNRQGGTYFSDLRKKNGHPEPYGVKYWGIGNEIYGDWQIGHENVADSAKMGLQFAKVMKWQDPSIKLVACGTGDPSWDRPVLESLVNHVDYISAHHYSVTDELKDYYEILGSVAQMEHQPYLDVAATYDEAKQRVTLAAVNRRKEDDMMSSVEPAGVRAKPGGRAFQITGTSPEAKNTFANPHAVVTQEVKLEASGGRFGYQFPRHSVSWLEFEVA